MRKRERNSRISVHAIAGTHVVLLGIDLDESAIEGVLGFAVERVDHKQGVRRFLPNFLLFQDNDVGSGPDHSSWRNPIQAFLWGDYTASPNHTYTYRIVAMYGEPTALGAGPEIEVTITTEDQESEMHAIYFNRGVAGSQGYADRFHNQRPSEVADREAYRWLSRGLEEGLLAYIARAQGAEYGLRAAFYEFQYAPVLDAFRRASESGCDVKIVYDCVQNKQKVPAAENVEAIRAAGIEDLTTPRRNARIAHNKFVVLLRDGSPVELWTGSANITEGGLFGQSNVGHIVRDERVASEYLGYWNELNKDPQRKELRAWCEDQTPVPPDQSLRHPIEMVFSPRRSLEALEWYAELMRGAQSSIFLTAAFGVSREILPVFESENNVLRYLLLNRKDSRVDVAARDPSNRVTAGAYIGGGGWQQWVEERLTGLDEHVQYVHTKYALIDPLGSAPIVITGSANFSRPSTTDNDENMMIISGNLRVADVYLGEFMRLFAHFRFRGRRRSYEQVSKKLYLLDTDEWARRFYVRDSALEKERLLFR